MRENENIDRPLRDGINNAIDHLSKTSKPLPEQEMSWSYETRRGTEISAETLNKAISTAAAVDELKTSKKAHEQNYGKPRNEQDIEKAPDTRQRGDGGHGR